MNKAFFQVAVKDSKWVLDAFFSHEQLYDSMQVGIFQGA